MFLTALCAELISFLSGTTTSYLNLSPYCTVSRNQFADVFFFFFFGDRENVLSDRMSSMFIMSCVWNVILCKPVFAV